ncbi:MAG: amidohydrolase [Planctomycetales bacterium]
MKHLLRTLACVASILAIARLARAADPPAAPFRPSQQTALEEVDRRADELRAVNKAIWTHAEVGLEERKSSALLIGKLEAAGFEVEKGVAGMPTAFVASWGSGRPIVGILAEYDALPGMSQKVSPVREPVQDGGNGHACGHSGLGTGALGAAIAAKVAMEKHGVKGTIRLYGTPAEETLIGKVYMLLDGQFRDLDACLHYHPSTENGVWGGSSKAMVSAKFTFKGLPAHASVSPESGKSALDAVELMNVGANFMREHLKEDARVHYVITDGGGAPNVVPEKATVWYFVRANAHDDVERSFAWLQNIAKGAALMTRTEFSLRIDTDCHELISSGVLAEALHENLLKVGPPKFDAEEHAFARRLQQPLIEEFGRDLPQALHEEVQPLTGSRGLSAGSTDVGDISWHVPTCGIRTASMALGSPGHSWQNVASIGSSIGEKGTIYAAKVLAATALDLFEKPELLPAAKKDFDQKMEGRKYTTLIPEGQKAPAAIR